jgi:hypothetical protein
MRKVRPYSVRPVAPRASYPPPNLDVLHTRLAPILAVRNTVLQYFWSGHYGSPSQRREPRRLRGDALDVTRPRSFIRALSSTSCGPGIVEKNRTHHERDGAVFLGRHGFD